MHSIMPRRQMRNRFRRNGFAMLAATLLAAVSVPPALAQNANEAADVTLRGRVIDSSNGQPVPLARIEVVDLDQRTAADARGEFELRLPRGSHLVRFREVGYADLRELWTATVDDAGLVVELTPDPIVLEAVRVQAERLESRIERLTVQARSFNRDDIRRFGHSQTMDFVALYAGVTPTPCDSRTTLAENCAWIRGMVQPVSVIIDELPSIAGMAELRTLPLQEIHRIEVIAGGAQVRVYTRHFVERLARNGGPLWPIPRNIGRAQRATVYGRP